MYFQSDTNLLDTKLGEKFSEKKYFSFLFFSALLFLQETLRMVYPRMLAVITKKLLRNLTWLPSKVMLMQIFHWVGWDKDQVFYVMTLDCFVLSNKF